MEKCRVEDCIYNLDDITITVHINTTQGPEIKDDIIHILCCPDGHGKITSDQKTIDALERLSILILNSV